MKTPRKRGAYFTGLPTQQLFGPFNKVFDGKAEVLEHGAGGCRFAEGIDANDIAIKADERSPVVADYSLDGDALAQFRRMHGVAVAGVLLRKDFRAWDGEDAYGGNLGGEQGGEWKRGG